MSAVKFLLKVEVGKASKFPYPFKRCFWLWEQFVHCKTSRLPLSQISHGLSTESMFKKKTA